MTILNSQLGEISDFGLGDSRTLVVPPKKQEVIQEIKKVVSRTDTTIYGAEGGTRTRMVSRTILSRVRLPFRHFGTISR